MNKGILLTILAAVLAFEAGRLSSPSRTARADAGDSAQVMVQQIGASTGMVVYYPDKKQVYVYQPFAGAPTWPCQYSIQLSTPGGTVERKACGS